MYKLTTRLFAEHDVIVVEDLHVTGTIRNRRLLGELRPEVKRPTGNPHQTATGGTGYRHGKTQTMSQRRPRKVATP